MSNSTTYQIVVAGASARRECGAPASGDGLWREHGWGLSGRAVAAIVAGILAVSWAVQVLGWAA